MPSFLAGTRNLMMTDCWMHHLVADIGAYIEIRSLVLARDDGVGSLCEAQLHKVKHELIR